jgi:hypothetical protein
LIRTKIGHVHDLGRFDDAAERVQAWLVLLQELRNLRRQAELRDDPGGAVLEAPQHCEPGFANASRRQHSEHRVELAVRLEMTCSTPRLRLPPSDCEVACAPQFIQQAHVLDRDDGLLGEIAQQLDLLVGEGADLLTEDADRTNELAVLISGMISNVLMLPN